MRQSGFIQLSIMGWLAVAALIAFSGMSASIYWYKSRYEAVKQEYATFQATVKAQGELAAKEAARINAENLKRKETADATNTKLRADVAALAKRLRDSRAGGRYVPDAAPGSASPDIASFKRADLERAIQRFDAGISGIVAEGDGAVTDLNSAKAWSQSITR